MAGSLLTVGDAQRGPAASRCRSARVRSTSWIRAGARARRSRPGAALRDDDRHGIPRLCGRGVGDEPRRCPACRTPPPCRSCPPPATGRSGKPAKAPFAVPSRHDARAARRAGTPACRRDRPTGPVPAGASAGSARPAGGRERLRHLRGPQRAAVGDGGVDPRHLQRRHGDVALADGEVRGVTGAELEARLAVLHGQRLEVCRAARVRGRDLRVAGPGARAGVGPGLLPRRALPRAVGDPAAPAPPAGRCRSAVPSPKARGRGDERVMPVSRLAAEPALGQPGRGRRSRRRSCRRRRRRPCAARSARRRGTRSWRTARLPIV